MVCFVFFNRWLIRETFSLDKPGTDGYRCWIYCFNFISKRFTYGKTFMSWNWFFNVLWSNVLTLCFILLLLLQITFFLGTILNEIFNKILKNWIQEPRPIERLNLTDQFGMPSSHSQFIWFFSTYTTLFILFRFDAIFIFIFVIPVFKKIVGNVPCFHLIKKKIKNLLDCSPWQEMKELCYS